MNSGSLRWRLLLAAAIAILIAMTVSWALMGLLFSRHAQRGVVTELTREALELVAGLHLNAVGVPQLEGQASDPRFDRPSSGRYWQASTSLGAARSLSLWDETLPVPGALDARQWRTRESNGPFGQRLIIVERVVRLDPEGTPVTVQVAQNLSDLEAAARAFRRELGLFLGILWVALVAAAWLQVTLGLAPLASVSTALYSLQKNPAARLTAPHPNEVSPLVSAINTLADAREKDLVRAKRRGADLAHSLKTPLSALRAISHRARESGETTTADDLDRVIDTAGAALEAELARSRAAAIRDNRASTQCSPFDVVERIVGVLEKTDFGGDLVYSVDIAPQLKLPLTEEDLMEALGALVENASRFARRQVAVSAMRAEGHFRMLVEDDGPGLEISTEAAFMRGGRLDELGRGNHGLGLSIAKEIVEAAGGTLDLQRSVPGGLQVALSWPATK
ncbi:ATP-binding protein [Pseudoxanthomonas yeongjuensis]|uniref:sensor histidine kinase n=1 Tax=Pseudoxanthomonas yeongjuensis TaxID=377616 RepID=UPI0013909E37|nr:sensor histidine kinase [Pseudoxanthomonas yeongjuensis]KAF1716026.1 ATP-binding protein [Pseudoxanthomonas yeongjuensis]